MWLLNFLPNWIYSVITFLSITGLIASRWLPVNQTIVRAAFAAFLVFGVYMMGAVSNEEKWEQRVAEVEQKVAEAEAKSAVETVKVVEKIVYKKQIVQQKGEEIVKYIEKEVVKYDIKFAPGGECAIPKEFVESINKAAE